MPQDNEDPNAGAWSVEDIESAREINPEVIDGLPDMPEEHITFVFALNTGMSQVEAYLQAYPDKRSLKLASLYNMASKLAHKVQVRLWVKSLRLIEWSHNFIYTREQHSASLVRLRELAIAYEQLGAATTAEKTLGVVQGFYDNVNPATPAEKAETNDLIRIIEAENPSAGASIRKTMAKFLPSK